MKDIRPLLANTVQYLDETLDGLRFDSDNSSYDRTDVEALVEQLNEAFNEFDSEFND